MIDEELAAAWLARVQGVELEKPALAAATASARRFGAAAREAAASLPFGLEPAGFARAQAALVRAESGDER